MNDFVKQQTGTIVIPLQVVGSQRLTIAMLEDGLICKVEEGPVGLVVVAPAQNPAQAEGIDNDTGIRDLAQLLQ